MLEVKVISGKQTFKIKGARESLEKFRSYFEGPPHIEIGAIKDHDDSLMITAKTRDAGFIKHVAKKFGCTVEIE